MLPEISRLGPERNTLDFIIYLQKYKNTAVYFNCVGIEYIPKEVLSKIKDKSISHNIFRIQSDGSIICGFYCAAFIVYMILGKILLHYTNLFSPNDIKKNDKICKYFKNKYGERKSKL